MFTFTARLEIVGGNPFVHVPSDVLELLFERAGKDRGPIPIHGKLNGKSYRQTLVRYRGAWRLYVNMKMLHDSPRRIGETVEVAVAFDPNDRSIAPHPKLLAALEANREAKRVYDGLSGSVQKEIVRYISFLKTDESVDRNVARAIRFLLGEERFIGRDAPGGN